MRKPNVRFRSSETTPRDDFRKYILLQLSALTISKVWKELFAEYNEKFVFLEVNNTNFLERVD